MSYTDLMRSLNESMMLGEIPVCIRAGKNCIKILEKEFTMFDLNDTPVLRAAAGLFCGIRVEADPKLKDDEWRIENWRDIT